MKNKINKETIKNWFNEFFDEKTKEKEKAKKELEDYNCLINRLRGLLNDNLTVSYIHQIIDYLDESHRFYWIEGWFIVKSDTFTATKHDLLYELPNTSTELVKIIGILELIKKEQKQ